LALVAAGQKAVHEAEAAEEGLCSDPGSQREGSKQLRSSSTSSSYSCVPRERDSEPPELKLRT